jgi:endonuclease/exonuclease/phosphatase family metal-dependent hydrolase
LVVGAPPVALPPRALGPACAGALGAAAAIASLASDPAPPSSPPLTRLRIVTFNIQQGFSRDGLDDVDAQIALIQSLDADVLGLQECDTSRLAGGNDDTVRYFARKLGMHAYYGPPPPAGTFGVAILSRHPFGAARTVYLESAGEQTAAVIAELAGVSVAVTHLGNDGPMVQVENALAGLGTPPRGVLTGDFNYVVRSPQHAVVMARLDDAWSAAISRGGERRHDDLDHLYVTRGLRVREARYLREPASDHPALLAEITLP